MKLNLKDVYYQIQIKAGNKWKTVFQIQYSHFKYLVVPFRLINAPTTFQAYINKVILGLLDIIYIVYLNNIVVYSNDFKAYTHYIQIVLKRLREYKLYANLSKYTFYTTSINFLGFVVSVNRVLINKKQCFKYSIAISSTQWCHLGSLTYW